MGLERKFPCVLLGTALFFHAVIPARAGMKELEKRVVEKTLANGMQVLVLPRRQSPTVALSMSFKVGSIDEPRSRSGLAHLLEHMMFKGTRSLGTSDWEKEAPLRESIERIATELDAETLKGAAADPDRMNDLRERLREAQERARRFVVKDEIDALYTVNGAQGLNAGTSADLTTYYVALPSNRLELWARIESERLMDPVMREFYSERDVVTEERRQSFETDPSRKLMALLLATAFHTHPYRRPVIGWGDDIRFLKAREAERFFRTYYGPNNAVLTAVGDVDPGEFLALVERYFGPLPALPMPDRRLPAEPEQEGERRAQLVMDAEPVVMIGFHKPTLPDEDDYAFDLIDTLLSGGRTSLLYRSLVVEQEVAAAVRTMSGLPGARYPNLFVIRAVPRYPHTAEEVEEAILKQLERLVEAPVSDERIRKAKNQMKADMIRGLRSNSGLASLLSYFASLGDWRYITTHLDVLEKITPARIRQVAARYFTARNRTVVTLQKLPRKEGSR